MKLSDEKQENWYFTFCYSQEERNNFVKITGTYSEARQKMMAYYGKEWAFQYSEKQFLPHIERFGLSELKINNL